MPRITLEVSEELSQQLAQVGDALRQATSCLRLPELLALSLQQPAVPAQVYRYILDFWLATPLLNKLLNLNPLPKRKNGCVLC
ncbi:hypothetical protein LC607_26425 [Nostoc sp. CHAB 5824]|nr:hypothetical protein [Nostoc sp. CHAB 5824]